MSRSSNQKRKRKTHRASGVPCEKPLRWADIKRRMLSVPLEDVGREHEVPITLTSPGLSVVITGAAYDA